jgi:hypothetical protein
LGEQIEAREEVKSHSSFDYMDYEVNQKRITLANTDLIQPLMSDEDDEFVNNKEYLFNKNSQFASSPVSPQTIPKGPQKNLDGVTPDKKGKLQSGQSITTRQSQNLHTYLEEDHLNEAFEKAK